LFCVLGVVLQTILDIYICIWLDDARWIQGYLTCHQTVYWWMLMYH